MDRFGRTDSEVIIPPTTTPLREARGHLKCKT